VLLENLLTNINQDINFSARTVTGLADVFCKMHDHVVKSPKSNQIKILDIKN